MDIKQAIKNNASLCVKCGLCSSVCPTYIKTRHESESPRGRIALMEGIVTENLSISSNLLTRLDHCLACLACEAVCPSEVKYGQLIDDTRALLVNEHPAGLKSNRKSKIIKFILQKKLLLTLIARALSVYQKCGLHWLANKIGLLRYFQLDAYSRLITLVSSPLRLQKYYPPKNKLQADIGFFTGCISTIADQETMLAAINLLTACGFGVHVPVQQQCCGGLSLHAGEKEIARKLADKNINAFSIAPLSKIVSIATGCTAILKKYSRGSCSDTSSFGEKVVDINQFLNELNWPCQLKFSPLAKRVVLHTPCSMRNTLQQANAPYQLLQRIPQLEIIMLPSNTLCCGAAGDYFLKYPAMANTLLEDTLTQTLKFKPDYIVTTNIGCNLHLLAGLRSREIEIPIMHPVSLLAKQLEG